MHSRSIHTKLVSIIIVVIAIAITITVSLDYKKHEQERLNDKIMASKLMAGPILNTIYDDMLEERADMVRHLIDGLKKTEGIERVQIIRSNGIEEAFQDFKTIDAVKIKYGSIKPEWIEGHANKAVNIAEGVDSPEFKKAFSKFSKDWKSKSKYYIEGDERPILTYLHPIEIRNACNACHETEESRGILMISTSLEGMYVDLRNERVQWIVVGILMIVASWFFLSLIIKKTITGPIEETVEVIKRISGGEGDMAERVSVTSNDELGYLSETFNNMLESLQKRDEANRQLFSTVIKSREEWVTTFDAIQDMICIINSNYDIIKVNLALARKFNSKPEAMIGKKAYSIFYGLEYPHPKCPHKKTLDTGKTITEEFDSDDMALEGFFDATTFPIIDETGKVTSSVYILRDITEESMLKDQLFHSEKMSSIGKFVAGIAHELNNPLMGIMGFSQILIDSPGDKKIEDPDVKDKLDKIYKESLRTAKIVQNLLTFARVKKSEKAFQNVNNLIRDTIELRSHMLSSSKIEVIMDLENDLPETMIDYYQMQQVFINVVNNATDAMVEEHSEGILEITSSHKGNKIILFFKDNGTGIPEASLKKIFDPFFTTKEVGKGTGLGLSITHGIIIEHSGTIDYECPSKGGTEVTIKLPIVGFKPAASEVLVAPVDKKSTQFNGKRILIADDEQSIREALSQVLSSEGFLVDSVRNGREALDLLKDKKVDAIVSDITMPEMNGMDFYNELKGEHPDLIDKVIFLTGDILSESVKNFLNQCGSLFLLKPFDPSELLSLLRKTLSK
ncbi:MAG: response regulator [Thermodesulfobacteriota bacterium]